MVVIKNVQSTYKNWIYNLKYAISNHVKRENKLFTVQGVFLEVLTDIK